VIRGTLLVIPVRNSVLYVEPLYLAAETGGGLPQLKRVIVSYADNVIMEGTLETALNRIFEGTNVAGAEAPEAPASAGAPQSAAASRPLPQNLQSLIREANQHYERAQQLLKQGNWAGYGDEISKLGEVLKRMPAGPSAGSR
jgi:uncharacterized protein